MVKPRLDVRQYELRGRLNLWNWAEGATVIAFREGHTIVFHEELRSIFTGLDLDGLPPFGAIVLALSALQDSWRLSKLALTHSALLGELKKYRDFYETLAGLDVVQEAWNSLAPSERKKDLFLRCLFDSTPKELLCAVDGGEVIDHFFRMTDSNLAASPDFKTSRQLLEQDLRCLRRTVQGIKADEIVSRFRTSVSHPLKPAPTEIPKTEFSAREFLRGLESDPELGELARLTSQLFPCVSLPKWVDDPDDTQQGGVSDITNRGDLDRLLLSELAQDDLTLAVRVALKESLYLRRESPPGPPQVTRVILVDMSIRSWGVTRLFSMAVGLAFALHAPARKESKLYSGISQAILPVDFTTREGLLAWMEELDTEFDPLADWTKLLAKPEFAEAKFEFVLVTSAEVTADADFRARLSQVEQSFYIATTTRQGDFRLTWRTPIGQRRVREAKLDLNPITPDKEAAQDLSQSDLPVAYYQSPFPLRFSSSLAYERTWLAFAQTPQRHDQLVLSVDTHAQLLRYTRKAYGGEVIGLVGAGHFHYARTLAANDRHYAIFGPLSPSGLRLIEYQFSSGECRVSKLQILRPNPKYFAVDSAYVYAFYEDDVNILRIADGSLAEVVRLRNGWRSISGRYFAREMQRRDQVVQLCYSPGEPMWREEPLAILKLDEKVVAALEPDGKTGPRVFITSRGRAIWPATGETWSFRLPSTRGGLVGHSRSDHKFVFWGDDRSNTSLVDLEKRTCTAPLPHAVTAAWRDEASRYAMSMQMRRRFRRIAINQAEQRIELLTGREAIASISLQYNDLVISESTEVRAVPDSIVVGMNIPPQSTSSSARGPQTADSSQFQHLAPIETGRGAELDLQRATWPDGSQAIWDQRGFLTLVSSNPTLPQCTIALRDSGSLAGWLSDGRRFGPHYFHGPEYFGQIVPAQQVFNSVIRPFMEQIG